MTTWLGSPPNWAVSVVKSWKNVGTYRSNVRLHPLQQHPLVQQARVESPVVPHALARKEPPEADPVVEVDHDDVVAGSLHDLGAVPVGVAVGNIA